MDSSQKDGKIDPCVLLAVDGSPNAFLAVDYAAKMAGLIPNISFVLVHILPQIPPIYQAEADKDPRMRKKLKEIDKVNREKGQKLLDKAKEHLSRNIPATRVETRLRNRHSGLTQDILNEALMGNYDALVVGRRGLTRAQKLVVGSVSNQLIQHAAGVPLWIVDGKIDNPKVLVAVDGSEASIRAVDHVAFMMGANSEAQVDFLHVSPMLRSYCPIDFDNHEQLWEDEEGGYDQYEDGFQKLDSTCLTDFTRDAVAILRDAGFSPDRIGIIEKDAKRGVARTIVNTVNEGGYGTLVLGRRGLGKSFFLGTISDKVIRYVEQTAVWLVN